MKKLLLLLTVVLAGSLAANALPAAVHFNFTFDGFCDAMETTQYSPGRNIPNIFVTGTHDLSPCGIPSNFVGGFKHDIPKADKIPPFATPVLDLSDPILGTLYALPYSLEYLVHKSPCVWANYFSDGTGNYLSNLGTCTAFQGAKVQGIRPGNPSSRR
ncbi:MAG: hypothetical protein DMG80_17020 [Acidobacteria bacterium]|jgi:hypothetical protein|nr:MAG: hypothetical protein DMG80_17020 [Acidobacteriota bacterium]